MWLQIRLYLLLGLMFAIIYAIVVAVLRTMGVGTLVVYAVIASLMLLIQYLIGPKLVELSMRVDYVSESEYPELHRMVRELAAEAGIPKPRVGISNIPVPNAFAFGRWLSDSRVCVTRSLLGLLSPKELRAVLGHEISHLKHRDVMVITTLSIVPMICWLIAWSLMFSGGRNRGSVVLLGAAAFILYFITNLIVLYASRIREYYADRGSVKLGNQPHHLATALYKLVYGSARAPEQVVKEVQGYKAFFLNDPGRALDEIRELSQIDIDRTGTIDSAELAALSQKKIRVGLAEKMLELLSTHPNMLKRIKHLSTLA